MEKGLYGQPERDFTARARENRFDDVESEGKGDRTEAAYRRRFGEIALDELLLVREESKILAAYDQVDRTHKGTAVRDLIWRTLEISIEEQKRCHQRMAALWEEMWDGGSYATGGPGFHQTLCDNALVAAFPIALSILRTRRAKSEAAETPKIRIRTAPRAYNANLAAALHGKRPSLTAGNRRARIEKIRQQLLNRAAEHAE
jgi:hypothetical protein